MDLNSVSALFEKIDDSDVRQNLLEMMQSYLNQVAHQNIETSLKQKVGTSDIVQQSLVKVIEHFDQFRGKNTPQFKAWLKKIVVNEIHKTRRGFFANKRDLRRETGFGNAVPEDIAADSNPTPSTKAMATERIQTFHHVLGQLSTEDAEVIRLRSIEGLSFKEIGEKMKHSENYAAKLWYRAVVKFEEKLRIFVENI